MLVIMTVGCLSQYFGSGPFWPTVNWSAEHCKTNWWTNLLYVNNLVGTDAQVHFRELIGFIELLRFEVIRRKPY